MGLPLAAATARTLSSIGRSMSIAIAASLSVTSFSM
jgi:hypothetical protein